MDKRRKRPLGQFQAEDIRLRLIAPAQVIKLGYTCSTQERPVPDHTLYVCLKGSLTLLLNRKVCVLRHKQALLATRNSSLRLEHKTDEDLCLLVQCFTMKALGSIDVLSLMTFRNPVRFEEWGTVSRIVRDHAERSQHHLFTYILGEFLNRAVVSVRGLDRRGHFLIEMKESIESDLSHDDSVNRAFGLSPYGRKHTTVLFKKQMGMTPKQFLINSRLCRSKEMLLEGRSVKEAAFTCGFDDEFYFSRLFKKHEGMSPREYTERSLSTILQSG